MTTARNFLLAALQRIVDGGDLTNEELYDGIPDPLLLDQDEKAAWEQLSHWADDDDIRARDERYASIKREWMRDHIVALSE